MSDKAFLDHLRSRLARGPKMAHPGPRPGRDGDGRIGHQRDEAETEAAAFDPVAKFRVELEAVGGVVEFVNRPEQLAHRLRDLAAKAGWRKMLVDNVPNDVSEPVFVAGAEAEKQCRGADSDWWQAVAAVGLDVIEAASADRTLTAAADVGVTMADWAVADSGTIVQIAAPGRPRIVSLLPPAHVALLPVERIVPTRAELFVILRRAAAGADAVPPEMAWPSNIAFITGPSRTADIESDLSIGVHGPGYVHVFLLN